MEPPLLVQIGLLTQHTFLAGSNIEVLHVFTPGVYGNICLKYNGRISHQCVTHYSHNNLCLTTPVTDATLSS